MLGKLLSANSESRALSYQSVWGAGLDFSNGTTLSGVSMSQDEALKLSTVYACVRIYVDTVSTLPMDAYVNLDGDRVPFNPRPVWVNESDVGVARQDHLVQVLISLLLDGNAFVLVSRGGNGDVVALTALDPSRVEVRRNAMRQIEYVYDHRTVLSSEEVLHITELRKPGHLRGISRVDQLKESLGLAKALEEFSSRFFGSGSITDVVIESPSNLTREQARELVDGWEEHHRGIRKAHRPGVLAGGAKINKIGIDPEQSQLLASRAFSVEDVCRAFRVPPHMVGVTTPGAMSYASVEQNAIQWVRFSVVPIVARLEAAYTKLLPSTAFVKFNLDSLLRGDTQTRFSAYSTGLQAGFMSVNDVRRLEDMPVVDGGDSVRVPLANVNLSAADLFETDRRTLMAQRLVYAGFDPVEVLKALDLPAIAHTGLPSTQLQPVSVIDPNNPLSVYPV
jgi:HK97 family phage portal protein